VTHHVCVGGAGGTGGWANRGTDDGRARAFGTILTPTTLDWSTVNHLPLKLDDSHSSVFVGVKFYESEAAVCLHPDFGKVTTRLEKWDEIGLGGVRSEVSDVDGAVVRRCLLDYGLVGKRTAGKADRGRNADVGGRTGGSGSYGWGALGLLICPVDSNSTRAEPFAIHGSDRLLGISLVAEGEETVTTRFSGVHVPHDTGIREGAEGTECLGKDLVVNLGAEVTDENVVMCGGVLLVLATLVCPIDTDLCIKDLAAVEGLKGSLSSAHIHIFNEAVVETTVLVVTVGDDLHVLDWTSDSEDLCEHVFGDSRGEVSDIEMGASLSVGGFSCMRGLDMTRCDVPGLPRRALGRYSCFGTKKKLGSIKGC
jgi:hypothetical protein